MKKFNKKIKFAYKKANKITFTVYLILRTLVLITFVRQLFLREWGNALLCLLSLVLFLLPLFIEEKYKINIPSVLEIIILCFIFSAEILGEINNFYIQIPHFDTILHTLNGFICAGVGFSLVDLLNKNSNLVNLSPLFVTIVAFCFSMTVGIVWEFFEFGCDKILKSDMQKDAYLTEIYTVELDETKSNKVVALKDIGNVVIYNQDGDILAIFDGYLDIGLIDTMKDLVVNFIGALCFSIFGYLYILNRDKYKFVDKFILTKQMKIVEGK